jgi:hypothetical protein
MIAASASKYFGIKQLVSSVIWGKYKEKAWELFDPKLIETIDKIFELIQKKFPGAKIVVNSWFDSHELKYTNGEPWNYRGYREEGCGIGSKTGAHYQGKAIDFDVFDVSGVRIATSIIRVLIIANRQLLPHLRGIEEANWIHVDTMLRVGYQKNKLCVFDAKNNYRFL